MSEVKEYLSGSLNPLNVVKTLKHKMLFARNNPNYFYPAGIWVFCGAQGSGKTLSAVQCLKKICKAYPNAIVCTNLDVKGINNYVIAFEDYEQIKTLDNGVNGIIFFLDELHILWNSLESKEIPISEMACFCQMRKNRRVIIGTSQVYSRIAKPIREQLQYVVSCKNYFGLLQHNIIVDPNEGEEKDGILSAKIIGHKFWFHNPSLYNSYDTLFKISKAERKQKKLIKRSGLSV
ncbi:MAG: zonular occludens toxin domain-containing protein [Acutalibacteraceae bacterium]|nr:zonular occludens toxin domain-containing protein [Acutalibacteraceae bacterium]